MMKRLGNEGVTLVEGLVGASILMVGILFVLKAMDFTSGRVQNTAQEMQIDNMISELTQDIRNNIRFYQVGHFGEYKTDEEYVENMELPMAWHLSSNAQVRQDLVPVSTCTPNCPIGRLGYRIVPLDKYTGFYAVYLVYENSDHFKGRKLEKFFVRGK